MDLNRLHLIADSIQTTCCLSTADKVFGTLTINHNWQMIGYRIEKDLTPEKILSQIRSLLEKYHHVCIDVNMFIDGDARCLEHVFGLFLTDQGVIALDSYIRSRRAEVWSFNLDRDLLPLLTAPSVEEWNRVWRCSETVDFSSPRMTLDVSYNTSK